ncbi:hypothetical protein D7X33_23140 [Butyricicoccus sp. 1XD8-22]|nr:hypothetical protein D7X33_23140 [Butyricicoccus sp. 1XD8-22]
MLSFPVFKEIVEKESNGRIEVEYVGGPESIPPFNQAESVQNGTIDMGWVAGSYYPDIVPEVLGISFSELSYEQELEKEAFLISRLKMHFFRNDSNLVEAPYD